MAEPLQDRDVSIDRIVLDYELTREYQGWLHERDRDRGGRPDRGPREIKGVALDHDLPYLDSHVRSPTSLAIRWIFGRA